MKHLMTLLALVVAVTAGAQSNNPQGWSNYDLPFNPDANNDNAIGSEDLLQVLAVFGNEYGNNPPACDYEGTDLENLWANLVTGVAIMDSLFYEVEMLDEQLTSYPGCPDMVWDTLNVIFSGMIYDWQLNIQQDHWRCQGGMSSGLSNWIYFVWNTDDHCCNQNVYEFEWYAHYHLAPYITLGWFENAQTWSQTDLVSLPFPDGWTLDESGIHFPSSNWGQYAPNYNTVDWLSYATSITIIPYWHYAE